MVPTLRRSGAWVLVSCSLLSGCELTRHVGEVQGACDVECDAGGLDASVSLPIGEASYPVFDAARFIRLAAGIQGTWNGLAASWERIGSPFELTLRAGELPGQGTFELVCMENPRCAVFMFGEPVEPRTYVGRYRLAHVGEHGLGEGDLSWNLGPVVTSVKWRNVGLREDEQGEILYFIVDSYLGMPTVIVLRRGSYTPRVPPPDAGTSDEDASVQGDAGVQTDAGAQSDASAQGDAGAQDDAGTQGDAGLEDDAGPQSRAAPPQASAREGSP